MESLSRSHSRTLREEEDPIEASKLSKKDSRSSFNDPLQKGPPRKQHTERDKDEDQRSNYSRKSSKKGLRAVKKEIIGMNTFSNNSTRRYLHFFQHD